jgi:hypothetical protein
LLFYVLEAFKRYFKSCKAKEKELLLEQNSNTFKFAGEEAERRRYVLTIPFKNS